MTEINPFNEQAYLYLGQLYINQKKLTEAIGLFDEAIELNPNFAEAYKERGRAKLLNGDKDGSGRGHEEISGIESERGSWSERRIQEPGTKA